MTKNEMLDCFAQNLERERVKLGYTQSEFASHLELSTSTYKNIVSRRTNKFDISISSKLYGITGKFLCEMFGFKCWEFELLDKFRKMTQRQKAYINALIEYELEMMSEEVDSDIMLDVFLLTGNMKDGMIIDSCHFERIYCPEYIARYGEKLHCGIRITSNHLHPVYLCNDIIGISKRPPHDGDTCIFIHKPTGRAYIRKFIQGTPRTLLPINGYGEPIFINTSDPEEMKQWFNWGVVITVFRR